MEDCMTFGPSRRIVDILMYGETIRISGMAMHLIRIVLESASPPRSSSTGKCLLFRQS